MAPYQTRSYQESIIVATESSLLEELKLAWQPCKIELQLDVGGAEYNLYALIVGHQHGDGHAFVCVDSPKLK